MNYQGAPQNVPQDSSDLVNNPRHLGQATHAGAQQVTGPQQESRYGAAPLNTAGNNTKPSSDPMDTIRDPAAYGFQKPQSEGFRYPGTQQQPGQSRTGEAGYGGQTTRGAGAHPIPQPGYGGNPNAQTGYGTERSAQPGFGAQSTGGYGADPNAQTGYGTQRSAQPGFGAQSTGGYGANPNAQQGNGGQTTGAYDTTPYAQPGYGGQKQEGTHGSDPNAQPGYGSQTSGGYSNTRPDQTGYGSQPTGSSAPQHHQRDDAFAQEQPGYGQPGFGAPSQGQNTSSLWPEPAPPPNAHQRDLVGQGDVNPTTQSKQREAPYNQEGYGYGTEQAPPARKEGVKEKLKDAVGIGHRGQDQNVSVVNAPKDGKSEGGYNTGMAVGADAYEQPRNEGVEDASATGVGVNSGYDAKTRTGNDAYVHGNHPPGLQDRVEGVNEPRLLGGERGRQYGVQAQEGMKGPEEVGYDGAKGGHFPGGQHYTGVDSTDVRGQGLGETTGSDTDKFNETTTGYDDSDFAGSAPPKKGLVQKIKDKLHH